MMRPLPLPSFSMARSLNLKVIAEGVEDEAQMSFLQAHHCDEIQGYYFSKPLGADALRRNCEPNTPKRWSSRKRVGTNRDKKILQC